MLVNSELLKIKKWADEGDANCQLVLFWCFAKGDMGAQNFELATHYLEKFIIENDIETCVNSCLETNPITPSYDEYFDETDYRALQYLYLVSAVGVFHRDANQFEKTALWFKKAIDLTEQYLKNKDDFLQKAMRYNINAFADWEDFEQYFNPLKYQNFYFKWEKAEFLSVSAANNNVDAFSQHPST